MPMSTKKVGEIIRDECTGVDERCDGYKEKIVDTLYQIIKLEEEHLISKTNIQKKVDAVCNATGNFLAKKVVGRNIPSISADSEDEDYKDREEGL